MRQARKLKAEYFKKDTISLWLMEIPQEVKWLRIQVLKKDH